MIINKYYFYLFDYICQYYIYLYNYIYIYNEEKFCYVIKSTNYHKTFVEYSHTQNNRVSLNKSNDELLKK